MYEDIEAVLDEHVRPLLRTSRASAPAVRRPI